MNFLEKDLEQIIYETEPELLWKRGLPIEGKLLRQKKIGNYGVADLIEIERININRVFSMYPKLIITIIELKKDNIDINAFMQAVNYANGIKRYLHSRDFYKFTLKIKLIGKNIDTFDSFCFLPNLFKDITFYTYDMDIDGLIFKEEYGYHLNGEGF